MSPVRVDAKRIDAPLNSRVQKTNTEFFSSFFFFAKTYIFFDTEEDPGDERERERERGN